MRRIAKIGKIGEGIAQKYLESKGYEILEKRFRSNRWGEIDLVCMEGDILVFVEVKTRISPYFGSPTEAVTYYKQCALKRSALYYCKTHPNCSKSLRMDVISIILKEDESVRKLEHYKNAF